MKRDHHLVRWLIGITVAIMICGTPWLSAGGSGSASVGGAMLATGGVGVGSPAAPIVPALGSATVATSSIAVLYAQAEAGVASAQYELGRALLAGVGIASAPLTANGFYRKAAAQGHARAMHDLGSIYLNGKGVPVDLAEAVRWYRQGADLGDIEAQYDIGWMLVEGTGIATDAAAGLGWLRRAADRGASFAQSYLGWMYLSGTGVEKDPAQAVTWYRRAADQGDASAQHALAQCYESGWGIASNTTDALRWYRRAIDGGNRPSVAAREKLAVREALTLAQSGAVVALADVLGGFVGDPEDDALQRALTRALNGAGHSDVVARALDGRLARLRQVLDRGARHDLASPPVMLARAVETHRALGKIDRAHAKMFRDNLVWRAQWASELDDSPAAAALLRHLVAIDPTDAWAWQNLAWKLNRQQKFAAADAVIDQALADGSRVASAARARFESVRAVNNLEWGHDANAQAAALRALAVEPGGRASVRVLLRSLIVRDEIGSASAALAALATGTRRTLPDYGLLLTLAAGSAPASIADDWRQRSARDRDTVRHLLIQVVRGLADRGRLDRVRILTKYLLDSGVAQAVGFGPVSVDLLGVYQDYAGQGGLASRAELVPALGAAWERERQSLIASLTPAERVVFAAHDPFAIPDDVLSRFAAADVASASTIDRAEAIFRGLLEREKLVYCPATARILPLDDEFERRSQDLVGNIGWIVSDPAGFVSEVQQLHLLLGRITAVTVAERAGVHTPNEVFSTTDADGYRAAQCAELSRFFLGVAGRLGIRDVYLFISDRDAMGDKGAHAWVGVRGRPGRIVTFDLANRLRHVVLPNIKSLSLAQCLVRHFTQRLVWAYQGETPATLAALTQIVRKLGTDDDVYAAWFQVWQCLCAGGPIDLDLQRRLLIDLLDGARRASVSSVVSWTIQFACMAGSRGFARDPRWIGMVQALLGSRSDHLSRCLDHALHVAFRWPVDPHHPPPTLEQLLASRPEPDSASDSASLRAVGDLVLLAVTADPRLAGTIARDDEWLDPDYVWPIARYPARLVGGFLPGLRAQKEAWGRSVAVKARAAWANLAPYLEPYVMPAIDQLLGRGGGPRQRQ